MKAKLLPEKIARQIVRIIEKGVNTELICGDGLYYIDKKLFGTEQEITEIKGALLIKGFLVPPYLIEEINE